MATFEERHAALREMEATLRWLRSVGQNYLLGLLQPFLSECIQKSSEQDGSINPYTPNEATGYRVFENLSSVANIFFRGIEIISGNDIAWKYSIINALNLSTSQWPAPAGNDSDEERALPAPSRRRSRDDDEATQSSTLRRRLA